jgi:dTDP-4-dehydrorhamnose 3,5-epimerase
MFIKHETLIPGFYELRPKVFSDERGFLIKVFQHHAYEDLNLNTIWHDDFYSVSKKGVLRGMHFQLPPFEQTKSVCCINGEVLDVVVDLRIGSSMFGKSASLILSGRVGNIAYIAAGLAHGFYVLSETATLYYKTSKIYNPQADSGIRWDSFGFNWPLNLPFISLRDQGLEKMHEFRSPFIFNENQ